MARAHGDTEELVYAYSDAWRYERFITTIEQRAGISWNQAERAARATLTTLGERISAGEARKLVEDVPPEIRQWVLEQAAPAAEAFDAAEFVRRVARREGVPEETAQAHIRAVLIALARLVRGQEIRNMRAQLSRDYDELLEEALRRNRDPSAPEIVGLEAFVRRVAQRAALEPADAQRAAEVVLETLAERVAGGEVEDFAEQLPEALRPALERGREHSHGHAQRMSLDEFIARIAEREGGIGWDEALDRARAVFAALRETLTDKEFSDVLAELPRGYHEALL